MSNVVWDGLQASPCTLHLYYAARGDEVSGLPSVLGRAGASVADACGVALGSFGEGDHVLPRVLAYRPGVPVTAGGHSVRAVADADLTLVALPFGGLVACLRIAVSDPRLELRPLLASARDAAAGPGLEVHGQAPLTAAIAAPHEDWLDDDEGLKAQLAGLVASGTAGFHFVAFSGDALALTRDGAPAWSDDGSRVDENAVAELIHYGAEPYGYGALRPDTGLVMPVLSNRYRGTLAAVGPNGAVAVAHAPQLTRAMAITTAMALAAMEQARFIWHAVYGERELLSDAGRAGRVPDPVGATPTELIALIARLRTWETELSYGAFAYVDIRPLVRSSVVGEFHLALSEAIALPSAVGTAQALLDRLKQAADGRRQELELLLRDVDDRRNRRLAVVGALFAVLAVVPAIVFGYFGSNVGLQRNGPGYFDAPFRAFWTWVVIGTAVALIALAAVIRAGRRDRSAAAS